jgi:hypothetical protein
MRVWQSRGRAERCTHARAHVRTSRHACASPSGSNAAISPDASKRICTGKNPDGPVPGFRSGRPKHAPEMHMSAAVSTRHATGAERASVGGDVSSRGCAALSRAPAGSLCAATGAGEPFSRDGGAASGEEAPQPAQRATPAQAAINEVFHASTLSVCHKLGSRPTRPSTFKPRPRPW